MILTGLFLSHPVELLFFQTGGKIPCADTQLQRLIADLKAGGKRLASDQRPWVASHLFPTTARQASRADDSSLVKGGCCWARLMDEAWWRTFDLTHEVKVLTSWRTTGIKCWIASTACTILSWTSFSLSRALAAAASRADWPWIIKKFDWFILVLVYLQEGKSKFVSKHIRQWPW